MNYTRITSIAAVLTLVFNTAPTVAFEKGDILLRAGATSVTPDDSSSNVFVGGNDLGLGVDVDSNTQLGLNLAYFITDQLALELLAATPFSHDITLNTVGALGETKHLPPTLSANYYFNEKGSDFQPYIGAGLNYTLFFDEGFTQSNKAQGFSNLELDNSFGVSAQVGFDYRLEENWYLNLSARWIGIDTDASFTLNGVAGDVSVDIDPFVYSLQIGYRL